MNNIHTSDRVVVEESAVVGISIKAMHPDPDDTLVAIYIREGRLNYYYVASIPRAVSLPLSEELNLGRRVEPADWLMAYSYESFRKHKVEVFKKWQELHGENWKEEYRKLLNEDPDEERIFLVTTLKEALEIQDDLDRKRFGKVHRITDKEYWEALEALPPENWVQDFQFEHFRSMEYTTDDWTTMYGAVPAGVGRAYACKTVKVSDKSTWLTREEVLQVNEGHRC